MCGRYSQDNTWAEVHQFTQPLELLLPEAEPEPSYNMAPTQLGWLLVADGDHAARAERMHWGLVPFWAKDRKIAYRTINARLETAAEKPAFRAAWARRRCLVVASGYYEWRVEQGHKQPWWIHPAQGRVLLFAGLWECNEQLDEQALFSYSILTRPAQGAVAELHERMPVCLEGRVLGEWLHGSVAQAGDIAHAAVPALGFHRVGKEVGNVRNQGPALIQPL